MNEFWFTVGLFVIVLAGIALYHLCGELLKRWFENDWCRHSWSTWQDNGSYEQFRHCSKCNKRERRTV